MEFCDTHCHLHFKKFGIPNAEAYQNARDAGIKQIICVGTSLQDSRDAIDFARQFDGVWAAAGAHPHDASGFLQTPSHSQRLSDLLRQPKVAAIGEIGLDYYKNDIPAEIQEKALRVQIETGLPSGLPFIFHVRDGWRDFWRIFDDYKNIRGVVHSFSSGTKQLNAALDRGLYIGLNGIMTFTRDHAQLEAAKRLPLDRLLLETDAPFLTPLPFRDDICEPKHIVTIAEFLAKLRSEPLEKLSKVTTDNAIRLFVLK